MARQIKLGLSMRSLGYHPSAWLDSTIPPLGSLSVAYYTELTQTAERGLFDMVFLADMAAVIAEDIPKGAFGRNHEGVVELEPLTLLAALAMVTKNIGLVATASTTHHQPYQLARQFASIDFLSGGRAGWNVVTSSRDQEARNFGEEKILAKDLRYQRARESVNVCLGLWESWEPDAFVINRQTGQFFDPKKMHPINHKGKFFRVDGPLTIPPTPQGRPLLVQAGASEDGMDFAATFGEVIYTVQRSLDTAQAFYKQLKERAEKFGRSRDDILIMPGILPVVAETRQAARAKYKAMQDLLDETTGLERVVRFFGDMSGRDLDGPLPDLRTDVPMVSRGKLEFEAARKNNWSIRQFMAEMAISHSHSVAVGTPADIVDQMEQWFTQGAADGFNILPSLSPRDVYDFVNMIVPEMQRRGLYRTAYESTKLRENLGLKPVVYGEGRRFAAAHGEDARA